MLNNEELLYVVDENNQALEPQPREFVHKNGLWHRTSGVWIINQQKLLLCQKRSLNKDVKPGFWEAFFGGHLAPKDSYQHNAKIEVEEELGIVINGKNLTPYKIFKSEKPTHKEFQQVFKLFFNESQIQFKFEKEEIDELKWIDIEELRSILILKKDEHWVQKPWDEEILNWLSS